MNELRKDYILDRWVIISADRAKRPHDFNHSKDVEANKSCPFCPGNEHMTPPEICRAEEDGRWIIRCFPNKYPATSLEAKTGGMDEGLFKSRPAYGKHEVIVETPDHEKSIEDLGVDAIVRVLDVCSDRIRTIKEAGVEYVLVFKNKGRVAGASLPHPHIQVIGMPQTPSLVKDKVEASARYRSEHNRCPYCDIWQNEIKSERRITDGEHAVSFTPYASRFPFEAWVMPKRHLGNIDEMTLEEKKSFAKTLKDTITRLNSVLDSPPYNLYFHVSPRGEDLHMHLELCPKLSILAGFELGSNMYINTMPPEKAAESYRKAECKDAPSNTF